MPILRWVSTQTRLEQALDRVAAETSLTRLLRVAGDELVDLLDGSRCAVSRVIGDLLVDLTDYLRTGERQPLNLYMVSDYPLTQRVLETGEPHVVRLADPQADAAEASLLRELGHAWLVMLALRARGTSWGLVEVYGDERAVAKEEIEAAVAVVDRVGELLPALESGARSS
jgi:transcriptional regulator with GAF, ATPase, and Fis domain